MAVFRIPAAGVPDRSKTRDRMDKTQRKKGHASGGRGEGKMIALDNWRCNYKRGRSAWQDV
ncbi:hypothetical protein E2C01_091308 [Portunus trituberculatus]|uniref:Uncharacterized protein n=1 Tax=Portunus trituberculatus TaxID=210409 RepID=A0A5B7JDM7_PORTR|nr:hypothetical protein [Portunus trituberculatus]